MRAAAWPTSSDEKRADRRIFLTSDENCQNERIEGKNLPPHSGGRAAAQRPYRLVARCQCSHVLALQASFDADVLVVENANGGVASNDDGSKVGCYLRRGDRLEETLDYRSLVSYLM